MGCLALPRFTELAGSEGKPDLVNLGQIYSVVSARKRAITRGWGILDLTPQKPIRIKE